MRRLRAWLLRAVGMLRRTRSDRDFARELDSHLQLHIDDNIRLGMSPADARRRALIALGGVTQTTEAYRDRSGIPMIETFVRDIRYGARSLRKTPSFTLAAIVILGLGIGVNTAIFTVVNTVVLRPLPFPESDRIMRVWHTPPRNLFTGRQVFALSPANFLDWQDQNQVFERMAIYHVGRRTLTGSGEPSAVITGRISSTFFPILGLPPIIGRGFTADEDRAGGPKTAMLSETTWRTRFGADQSIVGRTITIDEEPFTVVGVAPSAPVFLNQAQVWLPIAWTAEERAVRANHNYRGIAKLKPGIDVARAQADLTTISKRLEQQYPADNKDWGALVLPLHDDIVGDVRASLLVLLGAVGLVLLIACANLANLLLVRTHGRAKEIAVRTALGGSRARVVQQLLTEGLLLGVGGGIAGFLASFSMVPLLVTVFGTDLPRATEIAPDAFVLAFTAAIAVVTGLVAAGAPAWRLANRDANEVLKQGPGRGNSSAGDGRIRNLLVVSEVALALMLLIGAGLLVRTLASLRAVDPGFDAHNLLTATVDIPNAKYPTPADRDRFFTRVLQNLRALPGVESASAIDSIPLKGGSSQPIAIEGRPPVPQSELPVVAVRWTMPGYFSTARIRLLEGRDFDDRDRADGKLVAIVTDLAAERLWPGDSPIGKHMTLGLMSDDPREVVGIVHQVKTEQIDEREPEPGVYLPSSQPGLAGTTLVIRTAVPPQNLTRATVAAVQSVDPEQPVLDISTMETVIEESFGARRFALLLLSGFALLALALASIGIYSVLAYSVRQRVREIGIRMALGAPARDVVRMIVVEGCKPTVAGVAIGLVLAALLTRVLETLLFGVGTHDPRTFTIVATIVMVVGIVATLVPAFRATRVDPVVTLRSE